MPQRLALFGSTGDTGGHTLRLALQDGLAVRAYARTPDKIPPELRAHERLEVVQGDFADAAAIQGAIEGADFVISMGGNAPASKKSHVMLALSQHLVAGMRAHGVKRLVYQAGAFSPAPGTQNPFFVRVVLRPLLGGAMGISGMLADNDALMQYLQDEATDLDWTVTRPGQIKDLPSKCALKPSEKLSGTCHFVDLARFSLDLAVSGEQRHRFPYLAY